jgi:exo-beta-1,3-glucanase (GH17 family)
MARRRSLQIALILVSAVVILSSYRSRRSIAVDFAGRVESWSRLNWICYAPTKYDPKRFRFPDEVAIAEDLAVIRAAGFDGIITYESNEPLSRIPAIARRAGLMVIQGVWAPTDRHELERAATLEEHVTAYCVGNEGLGSRYSLRELDHAVAYLSNAVHRPVAISEQIHVYYRHPVLTRMGDWHFPIVHPHFGGAKSSAAALHWIDANVRLLLRTARDEGVDKPLFLKEVGMPTAGDPAYSEAEQARFLRSLLLSSSYRFALFEAFDRDGWHYISRVEPYWGLFRCDRSQKLISHQIPEMIRARSARLQSQER